MDTYIVEKKISTNAAILKINNDSTYVAIAYASGDRNLENVINLVNAANSSVDVTPNFIRSECKQVLALIIESLKADKINAYDILPRLEKYLKDM